MRLKINTKKKEPTCKCIEYMEELTEEVLRLRRRFLGLGSLIYRKQINYLRSKIIFATLTHGFCSPELTKYGDGEPLFSTKHPTKK